ncbi:MAG: glycosyltransferase family 9 protein [Muribaculaceae bacterium]|nr:glycosyltransferase family 9 protein [Muribaculaceae bacterium]
MAKSKKPVSVLLTRFSALGDVAMTVPAVYDACLANPDVHFIFVTRPAPAKVFVNPPDNLTVESIDLSCYKGPVGIWRLTRQLIKKYGVDTYVDLHDVLRTRIMRAAARMYGLRVSRLDKLRRQRHELVSGRNRSPLTPTVTRYADAIENVGLQRGSGFVSIYGGLKADPALFATVTSSRPHDEIWIAMAPFAAHAGKKLPLPMLREVAARLLKRPGVRIFVMGFGPEESSVIDSIAPEYNGTRLLNMAAVKAGIAAELALMSHCNVMLTADSANMHLASLAGLPAVSVWGATHPAAGFLGYGQRLSDCVQLDMACRPCSIYGNRPCRHPDGDTVYPCLNHITADRVLERLDAVLQRNKNTSPPNQQ